MPQFKILIGVLLSICLFFLSSCEKKKSKYLIGVSQCSIDEWRDKMNMEMQNEAALSQKIDLIILSSNDDTQKQIADIEYLTNQKVDLLILTPNEIDPITPVIEKVYERGIPVILVDRKINSDKYTAFIGADNYQIGAEVGRYATKLLDGKGNIAEIKGLSASSPAIERHRGFYDIIKDYPEMKIIFEGDGGWLKEEGASEMRKVFESEEHIDLVFVHNDRMAKGAHQEAEKEGKTENIYFLGIDGLPGSEEGIDMVLKNKLEATFLYPTGGDRTIQLAIDILEKNDFNRENILPTSVIDKTNARILKLQTDQIVEQQDKILILNQRVDNQLEKYTAQRNIVYIVSFLAVLFCILLIGLLRAYRTKNKLNAKLRASNVEINKQKDELEANQQQLLSLSQQLEEATHAKLAFFTDISHDFRTPLTLISGPVDMLLKSPNLDKEEYRWLKIIKKNIAVLLRLVNQIIEFRKVETNNIKIDLSSNNLDSCINDWNLLFHQAAEKNEITFSYKNDDPELICMFDHDKIERVYFNLLSNAFKFTVKGGCISVVLSKTVENSQEFIQITVSNTGNQLSDSDIKNIFERFYRVDSHVAGSGIGLALVKALIDLHQGSIEAVCTNEMTTFIVKIPDISSGTQPVLTRTYESTSIEEIYEIPERKDDTCSPLTPHTVLIIDDNEEIRFYIRSILKNEYSVLEASDGEEGLSLAYQNDIDIIISDIMMPKIDGIQLCTKIKEDVKICHIPVILLTAISLDEQRIKGFESGADAYISKPFNPQILEVRVRKMLENRHKIKKHLRENLFHGKSEKQTINTLDEELISKFRNYILDRISDSTLNVEDISGEFGFSRAQFFRKIKAITNLGPNEFIRIVRLNKSLDILKSGKNVSEVAYEVGFTSPSYFTKCFREYFHKNPSQIV